jgi:tetratricopeptide (TPR) repeat protein
MVSILFIALIATFLAVITDLLNSLPGEARSEVRKWLVQWFVKGAAIPLVVWIVFNVGIFTDLPDFVSSRMLQKMGSHVDAKLLLIFVGVLVIMTYWMAMTSGWLLAMMSAYAIDIRVVFRQVRVASLLLAPLAILMFGSYGWAAIGAAATIWMMPMLKATSNIIIEPVRRIRPSYSKATAQLHRGKYDDAEKEVLAKLEECEDDFDGWMMLADLYAHQFNDLPAAARMIDETCDQATTTISEVAVAYHRLADWYVELEGNNEAAINALEQICRRYPRTHVERMARQRIRKLSGERDINPAQPRTIALPSFGREFEVAATESNTDVNAAAAEARRYSEMLTNNPDDIAVREKFARSVAEQLNQPDFAIEQLQLLVDFAATDESAQAKVPQWLALMAAWHLKYRNDEPSALAIMKRLVHDHPQTAQAFDAQRRLQMIEMERRLRAHRYPVVDSSTA